MKGLGLGPLSPILTPQPQWPLPGFTPVWPQPTLCRVVLNLVDHPILMLSKNQVNDLHCSRFSPGLPSFSVKNQLNSFSKWGILHGEDAQWASFTGGSVSSNRDRGPASNLLVKLACTRLLKMNRGH